MANTKYKNIHIFILIPTFLYIISVFIGYSLYDNTSSSTIKETVNLSILQIFFNNVQAISVNILGFFTGGLVTIMYTIYNGLIHGVLIRVYSESYTLSDALLKIIPHGIVEIPAIIISCHIGLFPIYLLINKFTKSFKMNFKEIITLLIKLILIDVILIFIASIIEATITKFI